MAASVGVPARERQAESFVPVPPGSHFPLQNLPFGVFRAPGEHARIGVAIGEHVLDVSVLEARGLVGTEVDPERFGARRVFDRPALNDFLSLGRPAWTSARGALTALLSGSDPALRDDATLLGHALRPASAVEMMLPAAVGDYTDFYSSREHATNVGTMFRGPENALMPNWLHLPVAYHGRASTLVPSGTDIRRPLGQTRPPGAEAPSFGPSRQMDFELEAGFLVGPGNELGEPIAVERARHHIFGMVLVNDWSARDVQAWEYQPLGPFLAKNLGTSVSPWVVTLDALAPFAVPGPVQDPSPLPYLASGGDRSYDIQLEVWIQPHDAAEATRVAATNFRHLYWDIAQQLAHHTVNGCRMRPGDLVASGTISGPERGERGSLLELSWRGTEPVALAGGDTRTFLEDGDRVTITGWCEGDGYRVGFGEVTGRLLPARREP